MDPCRVLGPPVLKCCSFTCPHYNRKKRNAPNSIKSTKIRKPHLTSLHQEERRKTSNKKWYEGADIGVKIQGERCDISLFCLHSHPYLFLLIYVVNT